MLTTSPEVWALRSPTSPATGDHLPFALAVQNADLHLVEMDAPQVGDILSEAMIEYLDLLAHRAT